MVQLVDGVLLMPQMPCSIDGSKWRYAEYVYAHWIEMGAI